MAGNSSPRQHAERAELILVMGILSIIGCPVLGPFAYFMGQSDLEKMEQGLISPQERGMTRAGHICGAFGTGFLILDILAIVLILLFRSAEGPAGL